MTICRELVAAIDGDTMAIGPDRATFYVKRLAACYPNLKPHDVHGYAIIVTEILAAYPETICRRVVDPVKGLPGRSVFPPNAGELNGALVAETARRKLIRANAMWHIQERDRRKQQAAEDRAFSLGRGTAEQRAELVKRLLKPNLVPGEESGKPTPTEYLEFPPEPEQFAHIDISDLPDRP